MGGNEEADGPTDGTGAAADDPEFVWADERLEAASDEELREHVAELQERMGAYEETLADLRATVAFLLDAQAGFVDPATVRGDAGQAAPAPDRSDPSVREREGRDRP